MAKLYSYSDAAQILGRKNRSIVALNQITGGIMLGAAVHFPALLAWLDAKGDFFELSNKLAQRIYDKRLRVSRWGRTERIIAALGITIISAYFEAFAQSDHPLFAELHLEKSEQLGLAGSFDEAGSCADQILHITEELIPRPGATYDEHIGLLRDYYATVSNRLCHFVYGLQVTDKQSDTKRLQIADQIRAVPFKAIPIYEANFRSLCAEFPEVALWANLREHQATQQGLTDIRIAFTELNALLSSVAIGSPAPATRQSLARQYAAALNEAVLEPGDSPDNLTIPTVGSSYVAGEFRLLHIQGGESLAGESLWQDAAVRSDLDNFLAGYITSPTAVQKPLLILGQPGSGKSMLTRVLAAQLPASDYLAVRVVLRDVRAAPDIQDQIEFAIRAATGESISWPTLARSAGDALPVVLLDGFDELLLATGASQSDYLRRVARFQEREAIDGRPLVVIVTTRSSVADRATAPLGSSAIRLEPFDESRIRSWLKIWNDANEVNFRRADLNPCSPELVLCHKELAQQPLLLLMLALYDADNNALLHLQNDIKQSELYERLLRQFAEREVLKHYPGMSRSELRDAVKRELRRLSVVAFAMFNRGRLWVSEQDLDGDLATLLGPASSKARGLRAPLDEAQIVLGRFFFVYRAQAPQDSLTLEAYEFLHSTFGEYLLARFTIEVLDDVAARHAAGTLRFASEAIDDDLLKALLSFGVISERGAVVRFLLELFSEKNENSTFCYRDLLAEIFVRLDGVARTRGYSQYRPRELSAVAEQAVYAANLLILGTCVAETLNVSLFMRAGINAVDAWRMNTLLWRSQLTANQWQSLTAALSASRIWSGGARDIGVTLRRPGDEVVPIDLRWTFDLAGALDGRSSGEQSKLAYVRSQLRSDLDREVLFLCVDLADVMAQSLSPMAEIFGDVLSLSQLAGDTEVWTPAYAVEQLWLGQFVQRSVAARVVDYVRCICLMRSSLISGREVLARAVISCLGTDEILPLEERISLLKHVRETSGADEDINCAIIRTGMVLSELCGSRDRGLMEMIAAELKVTTDVSSVTGRALIALWRAGGISAVSDVIKNNRQVISAVVNRARRDDERLWTDIRRMLAAASLVL